MLRLLSIAVMAALFGPLAALADDVPRSASQSGPRETTPQQATWQEMEFTCFAHFCVNTFTDREWGLGTEDPKIFNPTAFDARQWARVCKEAGMKLLILTCNITTASASGRASTPSIRSRTVRGAARATWFAKWPTPAANLGSASASTCRPGIAMSGRMVPTPITNTKNQLRELLTNYGEITEVWWDGACGEGPNGKRQVYDWAGYTKIVRQLQPNALIFGMGPDIRWVGNEDGLAPGKRMERVAEAGPRRSDGQGPRPPQASCGRQRNRLVSGRMRRLDPPGLVLSRPRGRQGQVARTPARHLLSLGGPQFRAVVEHPA